MNFSVMGGLLDLQRDKKVEDFILYNLITKSTFKKKKEWPFWIFMKSRMNQLNKGRTFRKRLREKRKDACNQDGRHATRLGKRTVTPFDSTDASASSLVAVVAVRVASSSSSVAVVAAER